MIVYDVIEEIAAKLRPVVRTHEWDAKVVTFPAALIPPPEEAVFDMTYAHGMDTAILVFHVVVTLKDVSPRTAHKQVQAYANGSGSKSVRQALNAGPGNSYHSCDDVTVVSARIEPLRVGEIDCLGALFEVHITGQGE